MNERYENAVENRSDRLIRKPQMYYDDVASKMLKMRRKVSVQMKEQVFSRQYSISAINFQTESKSGCDSALIQDGSAVLRFRDFTSGPALATISPPLNLS